MARTGILATHVIAAAEALLAEGQQPTIRAVRERLGDTGSPNTIQRHLSLWRKARPQETAPRELPQGLSNAIAAELAKAAAGAREAAQAEIDQAQAEAAELAAAGEVLEAKHDELTKQFEQLRSEKDILSGRLEAMLTQADRLNVALDAARHEAQEALRAAATAQAQAQAQQERAQRAEAALEHEREALVQVRNELALKKGRLEAHDKKPG